MSCYRFVALLPEDSSLEQKPCSSQSAHAVLDTCSVSCIFYHSYLCLSHASFNSYNYPSLLLTFLFNLFIFAV